MGAGAGFSSVCLVKGTGLSSVSPHLVMGMMVVRVGSRGSVMADTSSSLSLLCAVLCATVSRRVCALSTTTK